MASTISSPFDPLVYRPDFPILNTCVHDDQPLVYLDNAASTQRPRAVIDAMVRAYEEDYANVHRGSHSLSNRSTDLYEDARAAVAKFIGAESSDEVIFTSGTTAAINLVARAWGDANVGDDDTIVLTEMEHHSNLIPWQQLAERTGCTLRFAPITDDGFLDVDAFASLLKERPKLVAVTAISNVLGTINPIEQIVSLSHEAGALVLVDAAQSLPHEPTDVRVTGADFLAFSGHKMLGPSGVGVLYGRRSLLDAMPPFLGGGSMIDHVSTSGFTPAMLPSKFEAGTPPIVPAIGLHAALDYLANVGLDNIMQHERDLTRYAHQQMQDIDGLRFLGPAPDQKAGIVSFVLDGIDTHDIALMLDPRGIAIREGHHCAMPLHQRLGVPASNRASFYLYNTRDDVDVFAAGLKSAVQLLRSG